MGFLLPAQLKGLFRLAIALFLSIVFSTNAWAERVPHKLALFSGLDKITGKITHFSVAIGDSFQFGNLQITPRACYSSGPYEAVYTDSFVEISEATLNNDLKPLFSGWMFAESPGLNALDHPIYDIWLTGCQQPMLEGMDKAPSNANQKPN